jgi:hypothetical protein
VTIRKVLNVGGGNKSIAIPDCFQGWQQDLLDIDPRGNPDIVCDSREMTRLPPAIYDAVYCSHNLEHYYRHDVHRVLAGFWHVLKADGFAVIVVPDLADLMRTVVARQLDIDDFLYDSPMGPITVCDVLYGFATEIERSGRDFYAHKTGFTQQSLVKVLQTARFLEVFGKSENLNVVAVAFKQSPNDEQRRLFNLPPSARAVG